MKNEKVNQLQSFHPLSLAFLLKKCVLTPMHFSRV